MNHNLAEKTFWESLNNNIAFHKVDFNNPIKIWIEKFIEKEKGSCIEIGCFPGRYLTIFGDLGYELNGIDLLPGTDTDLPQWLVKEKYKVGKFIRANFLEYDFTNQQFDIVYSLGFIEHFTDWESVVIKHSTLVKENGFIIIETPNFRGIIQRILHYTLDKINLKRHNIHSMNPDKWEQLLIQEGFTIIDKGYFQGFDFWVEEQKRNQLKKFLIKVIYKVLPLLKKILIFNSKHFSPFCGIVAKKK
ncbi:MAG: class I SAM-dependent methyltransferase [Bacteroidetes bacterium]|nr:class I SAM-dependent methyltransferase [Bacteroidota bacterium]